MNRHSHRYPSLCALAKLALRSSADVTAMRRCRCLIAAIIGLFVFEVPAARAGDNVWTGAQNMNWRTVAGNANWSLPPLNLWNNSAIDGAFFNGAAPGTITVGDPITLRGMRFNANGYTIV